MEQLDIFGGGDAIASAPAPAAADVQLSLFRPDARAMRAPRERGRKAAAPALRADLHTDALIAGGRA